MFSKGLTWRRLAEFFPKWMELRYQDSSGSRFLGIPALLTDNYINDMKDVPQDAMCLTGEFREPSEIGEIKSDEHPLGVTAQLNEKTYELRESNTWDAFIRSPIDRITNEGYTEIDRRILGLNFYTDKSGYPWYTECVTDRSPNEFGAVVLVDQDNRHLFQFLDRKYQDAFSVNHDEKIYVEITIPIWLQENNMDYHSLSYSSNTSYYEYSVKLNHIPIDGTLKLIDAIQDPNGIEIPQDGIAVSLDTVSVYNDISPCMNTWWEIEDDILIIHNPISSHYVVEYQYTTVKPGPITRTDANRSVHSDSPVIIIPSYIPPSGQSYEQILDINEVDTITIGNMDGSEKKLPGALYPPGSSIIVSIEGVISTTINMTDGSGYADLGRRLGAVTPNPSEIDFDIDAMYYTAKSNINMFVNYSMTEWPVINVFGESDVVNVHLPYRIKSWLPVTQSDTYTRDDMFGSYIRDSMVLLNISKLNVNMQKLLTASSYYRILLKKPLVYSGICYYDRVVGKTDEGFILSDIVGDSIKIFDANNRLIGSIPAGGYTESIIDNIPHYSIKRLKGILGPLVSVDDYIYFIVWSKDGQDLRRISVYSPQPEIIHKFDILETITDITYDGEHFLISAGNKFYKYKIHFDRYFYDTQKKVVYYREDYNAVNLV